MVRNVFIKHFYVLYLRTWLLNTTHNSHNCELETKYVSVVWHLAISHFSIITTTRTILNSFFVLINMRFLSLLWYSVSRVTHKYKMFGSLSAYRRLLKIYTHDLAEKIYLLDRSVVTIEILNNTRFRKLVFYDFSKEQTFVDRKHISNWAPARWVLLNSTVSTIGDYIK